MPQQNGPGNPYNEVPPPPPPPLALYVPSSVTDCAHEDQRRRIAQIEVAFAQRVSVLLSEAYAEILEVLRGEDR
jgi:hypothetical protein